MSTNSYYQEELVDKDPAVRDAILVQLEGRSSSNPILSGEIEGSSGSHGATVRDTINQARQAGALIGSGRSGYYLCTSVAEAAEVADSLQARADKIAAAAAGMYRTIEALRRKSAETISATVDPVPTTYEIPDNTIEIDINLLLQNG